MKNQLLIYLGIILFSCSGSDDSPTPNPPPTPKNVAPTTPVLLTPSDGQLCTDNPLDFSWNVATDADGDGVSYEVQTATNSDFSESIQTEITSSTTTNFSLIKGVAYYWRVRSKDTKSNYSNYSSVRKYYSEGEGITNHLPFTPALVGPALNGTISDATTNLEWTASDVDGDPLTYDVYFGDSSPPALVLENSHGNIHSVNINPLTTYYWKIVVKDDNGGQAIGQIWSFISE